MTIETNGHRINIDIDPLLFLVFLGDKVDKKIVSDIATPNFSVVVRPSRKAKFTAKVGDYDIVVRKDDGEEITLDMPHRGAKMMYVLTLFCQKAVGGLPNKFFTNEKAAEVIKSLYDKLYRSGGGQWVRSSASNKHNLSTFRTHANNAVVENKALDNMMRYWCGFEDERRTVGKRQLQLRRIRISNDRILFEDAANNRVSFEELIRQLPPLEDVFGLRSKTMERINMLRSLKSKDTFTLG
ncbi:MAG: hypothetical protein J5548_05420 [Prevotella sp.]|nr:hypothetical protein [Prevotella sp.]